MSTKSPSRKDLAIAGLAIAAIAVHLVLRAAHEVAAVWLGISLADAPLLLALLVGGGPLVLELVGKLAKREFGSDLLAGISIVTSVLLHEYLAGTLVVLMLSGGQALESYALGNASRVLQALARRVPSIAHRRQDGRTTDVPIDEIGPGDTLTVLPHETCPVDGIVVEGHGGMDESYLTGEPYRISKTPGCNVLSGSINGDAALIIRAEKRAIDSRYAKIVQVMRECEERRPRLRRLGDQLGAVYTPIAVAIALVAWAVSGEAVRFLAVMVVATPCPLLIAIPVAIIGGVSLAARRGIIIRDPTVLEKLDTCRTAIFDKTGTLTFGRPDVTEIITVPGVEAASVLQLAASLERFSKHPLAHAILDKARKDGVALDEPTSISERPGEGLRGLVNGRDVHITGRTKLLAAHPDAASRLPPIAGGLECVVLLDGVYVATIRFRDEPRPDSASFVHHLGPRHRFQRVLLVSGDRESEVRHLADRIGITEVHADQSPEEKVSLVRAETARSNTLFAGDGINDAPALTAATVGIAFGSGSDVTSDAAGAVVLEPSLAKIDELMHIGRRMRRIALESAVGGMALSVIGMAIAAAGMLSPVAGAIAQEIIDVLAVLNALRASVRPASLNDYRTE